MLFRIRPHITSAFFIGKLPIFSPSHFLLVHLNMLGQIHWLDQSFLPFFGFLVIQCHCKCNPGMVIFISHSNSRWVGNSMPKHNKRQLHHTFKWLTAASPVAFISYYQSMAEKETAQWKTPSQYPNFPKPNSSVQGMKQLGLIQSSLTSHHAIIPLKWIQFYLFLAIEISFTSKIMSTIYSR